MTPGDSNVEAEVTEVASQPVPEQTTMPDQTTIPTPDQTTIPTPNQTTTPGGSGGSGGEDLSDNKDLTIENVPGKIKLYKDLLTTIFKKTHLTKKRLDTYQQRLHRINSFVQLSVIYFSAASSFVQALSSDSYQVIFDQSTDNINNSTMDTTNEINSIDQSTYAEMVPTITLCISTYSSLIIAGARHLKIEEHESNVANLRNRFSELISRIKYNIDLLKPWENINYYSVDHKNEKIHDWITLLKKIDKEYIHIVDVRKDLYHIYGQIVNTGMYSKYVKSHPDPTEKVEEPKDIFGCWLRKKTVPSPPPATPSTIDTTTPPATNP